MREIDVMYTRTYDGDYLADFDCNADDLPKSNVFFYKAIQADELAALRSRIAELESQSAMLAPRRCSRECYLRGWQAAQEAAVTVLSDWNLSPYLVGSKFGGDTIPFTIREHLAECVRALQPPADCGDCNPLKPE